MYALHSCPSSPGFPCPFVDAPPLPLFGPAAGPPFPLLDDQTVPMVTANPLPQHGTASSLPQQREMQLATFTERWSEAATVPAFDVPSLSVAALLPCQPVNGLSIPCHSPAVSVATFPAAFASVAQQLSVSSTSPATPATPPYSMTNGGQMAEFEEPSGVTPCVAAAPVVDHVPQLQIPHIATQRKDSASVRAKARSYTKVFVGQLPASGDLEAWLGDLFGPYGVHEVRVRRNPRSTSAFVWCKSREMAEAAIKRYDGYKYACGGHDHALCVEPANACR